MRAILIKLGVITPSVVETYTALVLGEISADMAAKYTRPSQVGEFIALHSQVKEFVDGETHQLPEMVTISLTHLLIENRRRFYVVLPQIDKIIEGLEKKVLRHRGQNVVRRED